jgi:predicted nucleic acid-binding protein
MTGYLFDTNVICEVRKPKPHGAVLQWIASLAPQQIFVPGVALFEMQAGVELTRRQDPEKASEIEKWIDDLCRLENILSMDAQSYRLCAKLISGRSPDVLIDAMIAATASVNGLTVATRNTADYRQFEVPIFNPFPHRR